MFVHLHTHSHYSLLDGLAKIDDLVKKAKSLNMTALALTDHGVMYGSVEFYQKAKKAGIKPILGVEAYVARDKHTNKRPGIDVKPYHLLLLAKNETGYKNLIKLTTIAHVDGFYYKPRIDHELLKKYSEGLICSSACLAGEVARHFVNGDDAKAEEAARWHMKVFGKDNYYLEVQHHPSIPEQALVNEKIFLLAEKLGLKVIATGDVHYLNSDDDMAHDALVCIQTKKILSDTDRMSMVGEDFSLQSPEMMAEHWKEHPEVIKNTMEIAEKCSVELQLGKTLLPRFEVPSGKTDFEYLQEKCEEGLLKRYGEQNISSEMRTRLDYELSIIQKTGYSSYFLIVADFINWAKDNGIVVGPGRGSAAGSLVAYLVEITNIDPLKYDLIFERFLNPERVSMPDIDTDFADTRRDEVIDYISQKYGRDQVAQIITFGTMAARAAIRDVGRVMGLPYAYCDKVAKMVPMFTDLKTAIETVPELKEVSNEPDGKRLLEMAKKLEGCARHASTHACGLVVTPDPMDNWVPRQRSNQDENEIITQYEMHAVEDLGLLKIDLLGLRNLTIIENTLDILKKGRGIEIDIEKIPLDDKKTFELFQQAETTGVFQLESSGMKRYLKQLKPTELEDIIVMVSLYRPGPMELIPDYISAKHGKRKVTYLDDRMKPILEKTYGIIVYQEQLMQIARVLAGFTYGEADVLRKAVGKKIASLLKEQEEKMIQGMVKNGTSKNTAKQIWDYVLPFARYGFNRSHAACYAMIAYQTAYLKAHYPSEFMAALMTADHGNNDRIALEVEECRQMGITVLPPDVNESYSTFTVVYDEIGKAEKESRTIRFGLTAVKNLGENIIKELIKERRANGKYISLEDFLSRVKTKDLNKKSLEAMIKSGALDKLGERNQLIYNIEKLLNFIKSVNAEAESKQASLFGMLAQVSTLPKLSLDYIEQANEKQKLNWEKEFLNLYVSSHPLSEFSSLLKDRVTVIQELITNNGNFTATVRVAGVITNIKKIITRKGESMVFAKIEDVTGGIEVLVFPSVLREYPEVWQEDKVIIINSKLSDKDGETKLIVNHARELVKEGVADIIQDLEKLALQNPDNSNGYRYKYRSKEPAVEASKQKSGGHAFVLVNGNLDYDISRQLKNIFTNHSGEYKLYLAVKKGEGFRKVLTDFSVDGSETLKQEVEKLLGEKTFAIKKF